MKGVGQQGGLSLNTSQARIQRNQKSNDPQTQQQQFTAHHHHHHKSSHDEISIAVLIVTNGIRGQNITFAYPVQQQEFVFNQNQHHQHQQQELTVNSNNAQSNHGEKKSSTQSNQQSLSVPTPTHPRTSALSLSIQRQRENNDLVTTSVNSTNSVSASTTNASTNNILSPPILSPTNSLVMEQFNQNANTSGGNTTNASNNTGGSATNNVNTNTSSTSNPFSTVFGWHAGALSFLLCPPRNNVTSKLLSVTIDDLLFLSQPTSMWNTSTTSSNMQSNTNVEQQQQETESFSQNTTSVKKKERKSRRTEELKETRELQKRIMTDYTNFSIVFVFEYGSMPDQIIRKYSQLLSLLMKTYEREQKRCMYIANELSILNKIKDTCKDWDSLAKLAYEKSRLAQELITIVQCIKQGRPIQQRLNGWLEICYNTPTKSLIEHEQLLERKRNELFVINNNTINTANNNNNLMLDIDSSEGIVDDLLSTSTSSTTSNLILTGTSSSSTDIHQSITGATTTEGLEDYDDEELEENDQQRQIMSTLKQMDNQLKKRKKKRIESFADIRPYHACLQIEDCPKLNDPPDGLHDVSKVYSFLSPTKSMLDISRDTNMTLDLVCSIAQHLINWGLVRTIPHLTNSTILCVSNDSKLPSHATIRQFSNRFNSLPSLIELLELFSVPRCYQEHLERVIHLIRRKNILAETLRSRSSSLDSIFDASRSNTVTASSSSTSNTTSAAKTSGSGHHSHHQHSHHHSSGHHPHQQHSNQHQHHHTTTNNNQYTTTSSANSNQSSSNKKLTGQTTDTSSNTNNRSKLLITNSSAISSSDELAFTEAVIWLLQKNYIKPVYRYIYMMIPQKKLITKKQITNTNSTTAPQSTNTSGGASTGTPISSLTSALLIDSMKKQQQQQDLDNSSVNVDNNSLGSSSLNSTIHSGVSENSRSQHKLHVSINQKREQQVAVLLSAIPTNSTSSSTNPLTTTTGSSANSSGNGDPSNNNNNTTSTTNTTSNTPDVDGSATGTSTTSTNYTKHSLTAYEMEYLKSVCNDRKLMNLFKRLCIYFNGQYHEQEIIWLENITQQEMTLLLTMFRSVLLIIEQ